MAHAPEPQDLIVEGKSYTAEITLVLPMGPGGEAFFALTTGTELVQVLVDSLSMDSSEVLMEVFAGGQFSGGTLRDLYNLRFDHAPVITKLTVDNKIHEDCVIDVPGDLKYTKKIIGASVAKAIVDNVFEPLVLSVDTVHYFQFTNVDPQVRSLSMTLKVANMGPNA